MINGLDGFKILSEQEMYIVSENTENILGVITVILVLALVCFFISLASDISPLMYISGFVFALSISLMFLFYNTGKEFRVEYSITPIEDHYSIDLTKYEIKKQNGEIIIIRSLPGVYKAE